MKDPAPLNGQLLDPGLEIRRLLVDEPLQILDRGAERRLEQHPAGEHQKPRVAARQPANCLQSATLPDKGFRKFRVSVLVRERCKHPLRVLGSEAFEHE